MNKTEFQLYGFPFSLLWVVKIPTIATFWIYKHTNYYWHMSNKAGNISKVFKISRLNQFCIKKNHPTILYTMKQYLVILFWICITFETELKKKGIKIIPSLYGKNCTETVCQLLKWPLRTIKISFDFQTFFVNK